MNWSLAFFKSANVIVSGVGALPSVQKRGPADLGPAEQAKLRTLRRSPKTREPN